MAGSDRSAAAAPPVPFAQKQLAGFDPKKSSMVRLAGRKSSDGAQQRDNAALRQQLAHQTPGPAGKINKNPVPLLSVARPR
jgi:hypothetical protein